jgi:hypothetical protein
LRLEGVYAVLEKATQLVPREQVKIMGSITIITG